MYCSSCGTAVKAGLSYCNRCGAEVDAKERSANKLSELSPNFLVCAIVCFTIVGLAAIITLLSLLKQTPEFAGVIMAFSMLSFLIVLATEIVFIRLLLRPKSAKGADPTHLKGPTPRELGMEQGQALPQPTSGVTEHTTRALEAIPRQRKAE